MRGQPARPVRWETTREKTRSTAGTSPRGPPNAQVAGPLHPSALAQRPGRRPHPRPRPPPRRDPYPQSISVRHFGLPHAAQVIQVTRRGSGAAQPPLAHRDRVRGHQPARRPGPPCPAGSAGTGASRRCTRSATPPSPRTPPRPAQATPPRPWPACATSLSASCVSAATATLPPRCAATPRTPTESWPCWVSQAREPDTPTRCREPGPGSVPPRPADC